MTKSNLQEARLKMMMTGWQLPDDCFWLADNCLNTKWSQETAWGLKKSDDLKEFFIDMEKIVFVVALF